MESILKRIEVDPATGCWNFIGSKCDKGYGLVSRNKRTKRVHRLSYQYHRGCIPEGLFVCHKCDNPACCNPDHLFLGTALDNNRDRESKGRGADRHGERHPSVKLTDSQVADIRAVGDSKQMPHSAIAKQYGVSRARISQIIRRQDRII